MLKTQHYLNWAPCHVSAVYTKRRWKEKSTLGKTLAPWVQTVTWVWFSTEQKGSTWKGSQLGAEVACPDSTAVKSQMTVLLGSCPLVLSCVSAIFSEKEHWCAGVCERQEDLSGSYIPGPGDPQSQSHQQIGKRAMTDWSRKRGGKCFL